MDSWSSTSDCSWPNSWWLQHVFVQTFGNVIFPAALCWSSSLLSWLNKKTLKALWRRPWGWCGLNLWTSYLLAWPMMSSALFTVMHWSLDMRSSWLPIPVQIGNVQITALAADLMRTNSKIACHRMSYNMDSPLDQLLGHFLEPESKTLYRAFTGESKLDAEFIFPSSRSFRKDENGRDWFLYHSS